MARTFPNPVAFKMSLEQRLKRSTNTGAELGRSRQLLVFDRFLARVFGEFGDAATLKGGLALELRIRRARTTKDIDVRLDGAPADILARLQRAGRRDLGDFMTFELRADERRPQIKNEGLKEGGLRFRAECRLGGKIYGRPFPVDVAFGDPIYGEPSMFQADDVLAFAGVAPPVVRVYPVETHIAEKLHAYTLPRERQNSRVKDLPDIALLATSGVIDADDLRAALTQTFSFRDTHPLPNRVPKPPPTWGAPYLQMAKQNQLVWGSLDELMVAVRAFVEPVLAESVAGHWEPERWCWGEPSV